MTNGRIRTNAHRLRDKLIFMKICLKCRKNRAEPSSILCTSCGAGKHKTPSSVNKLKDEVYEKYGGYKCACCGLTDRFAMSIDHIHGAGGAHLRIIRDQGYQGLLHWLKAKKFPPGFQVLCWYCNLSRFRHNGTCHHKGCNAKPVFDEGIQRILNRLLFENPPKRVRQKEKVKKKAKIRREYLSEGQQQKIELEDSILKSITSPMSVLKIWEYGQNAKWYDKFHFWSEGVVHKAVKKLAAEGKMERIPFGPKKTKCRWVAIDKDMWPENKQETKDVSTESEVDFSLDFIPPQPVSENFDQEEFLM